MMRVLQDHVRPVDHRPDLPFVQIGPAVDGELGRAAGQPHPEARGADLVPDAHAPGEAVTFLGPCDVSGVQMMS